MGVGEWEDTNLHSVEVQETVKLEKAALVMGARAWISKGEANAMPAKAPTILVTWIDFILSVCNICL